MESLGIPQPNGEAVTDIEAGVRVAERIGYPVLVRPSYVLGGRAMQIVPNEEALRHYLKTAVLVSEDQPVLVDHYITGKELETDAVCDGTRTSTSPASWSTWSAPACTAATPSASIPPSR